MSSFNPYYNQDFIGFFSLLFQRLFAFFSGESMSLAADELQLLVLVGIAVSAGLVGTWLVLRKLSMLANSLSHTTLLGVVLVFFWESGGGEILDHPLSVTGLFLATFFSGLLTTFATEFLSSTIRLQEDASNGIVFTLLFSIGILLVTVFSRNAHVGTELIMGNVDMLHKQDLLLVWLTAGLNIFLLFLFVKGLRLTTFDPMFARTLGVSLPFFHYFMMTQVSFTVVGAFRAVGVLMVLALIIGQPLIARWFSHTLKGVLLGAVGVGVLASFLGVALSRHLLSVYGCALSTGGLLVCIILLLYVLAFLFSPYGGALQLMKLRRHYRAREERR